MKIKIDKNIDTAFKICEKALKSLDISIDEIDKHEAIIFASTKSGLISWGEDIELHLDSIDSNNTSIEIISEAKAQLITWGKNDKNIKDICDTIKRISKSIK
jgi:hypothetical protein